MMCDMRERFWVPKLRSLVKKVVHKCNQCKRYRVKSLPAPPQSMLPELRAQHSDFFVELFGTHNQNSLETL